MLFAKTSSRSLFVLLVVIPVLFASPTFAATSDFTVFRPATATWYSSTDAEAGAFTAIKWGLATDVLVPADYDGDGILDVAVWRPSEGIWYILRSSDGLIDHFYWGKTTIHPTGGLPDVPVPDDFDGDGRADIAVWRPDTGMWHILLSSKGYSHSEAMHFQWGRLGDVPVNADYDGDGLADIAVFRPYENNWYIFESRTGTWNVQTFGTAGYDILVPADYTGDGRADIAIFRRGTWYVLESDSGNVDVFEFGFENSIPVPADYDGDGKVDFAVFQGGRWYINESSGQGFVSFIFGVEGDIPVNSLQGKTSIVAVP
jgi:hypothetical protein